MTGNETRKSGKLQMYERRDKKEFLSLLKQAWTDEERHFSEKERYRYKEWLNYLQYFEKIIILDKEEVDELYIYINKTVRAYLDQSLQTMNVNNSTLNELQNIYFIIEYFSLEKQSIAAAKGLSNLFYQIIAIEQYHHEKLELLMEFYEKSELLYKTCYYLYYYYDYLCEEQVINTFLSGIRNTKSYKLFSMFLNQINPIFIKQTIKILPGDCNPKELFYGICCGYFPYTEGNDIHKRLIELCEVNAMCIGENSTVENPLLDFLRSISMDI